MAKAKPQAPQKPTTLEMLGARLQKSINAPTAQKNCSAIIYKASDELQEDWDQIMEAINETDGVYVSARDDGGVKVHWDVPEKD